MASTVPKSGRKYKAIGDHCTRFMPLNAGDRVGSYEVIAKIGEGGMGEVYRARDPRRAVRAFVRPVAHSGTIVQKKEN